MAGSVQHVCHVDVRHSETLPWARVTITQVTRAIITHVTRVCHSNANAAGAYRYSE